MLTNILAQKPTTPQIHKRGFSQTQYPTKFMTTPTQNTPIKPKNTFKISQTEVFGAGELNQIIHKEIFKTGRATKKRINFLNHSNKDYNILTMSSYGEQDNYSNFYEELYNYDREKPDWSQSLYLQKTPTRVDHTNYIIKRNKQHVSQWGKCFKLNFRKGAQSVEPFKRTPEAHTANTAPESLSTADKLKARPIQASAGGEKRYGNLFNQRKEQRNRNISHDLHCRNDIPLRPLTETPRKHVDFTQTQVIANQRLNKHKLYNTNNAAFNKTYDQNVLSNRERDNYAPLPSPQNPNRNIKELAQNRRNGVDLKQQYINYSNYGKYTLDKEFSDSIVRDREKEREMNCNGVNSHVNPQIEFKRKVSGGGSRHSSVVDQMQKRSLTSYCKKRNQRSHSTYAKNPHKLQPLDKLKDMLYKNQETQEKESYDDVYQNKGILKKRNEAHEKIDWNQDDRSILSKKSRESYISGSSHTSATSGKKISEMDEKEKTVRRMDNLKEYIHSIKKKKDRILYKDKYLDQLQQSDINNDKNPPIKKYKVKIKAKDTEERNEKTEECKDVPDNTIESDKQDDEEGEEKEIENEEDLDELEIQKKIAELYLELLQQRKKKKVKEGEGGKKKED